MIRTTTETLDLSIKRITDKWINLKDNEIKNLMDKHGFFLTTCKNDFIGCKIIDDSSFYTVVMDTVECVVYAHDNNFNVYVKKDMTCELMKKLNDCAISVMGNN